MQKISLSIPDDVAFEVSASPRRGTTIDEKLRFSLALGLFVSGDVSLAKAAQVAGNNLPEFMGVLQGLNLPAFSYTEEMLADDLKFAGEF
jgi:predicted HTH domain antitoxin